MKNRIQNLKDYKLPKSWNRGKHFLIEFLWQIIFKNFVSSFLPGSFWRRLLLSLFGAKIGEKIRFSSGLKVKMPWRLVIGNYCWIGEDTWIDNISKVTLENNVCISQGVYFCTGNHNFRKNSFDLICKPIYVSSNVWIGAKSIIAPGIKIGSGSVITLGSVVKKNVPKNSILKGCDQILIKKYFK